MHGTLRLIFVKAFVEPWNRANRPGWGGGVVGRRQYGQCVMTWKNRGSNISWLLYASPREILYQNWRSADVNLNGIFDAQLRQNLNRYYANVLLKQHALWPCPLLHFPKREQSFRFIPISFVSWQFICDRKTWFFQQQQKCWHNQAEPLNFIHHCTIFLKIPKSLLNLCIILNMFFSQTIFRDHPTDSYPTLHW